MKVGILCEYSGRVRDAFIKLGHDAVSCDLLPTDAPGPHIQGDCLLQDWSRFDLLICHPPCTHLAVSGARYFYKKQKEQIEALNFVIALMALPVERICIENPISVISSKIRKPDQIIQPWQFGHGETKATCLWLKGLSKLIPTNIVGGREQKCHLCPPSKDRWKIRSTTYQGIADAMAQQWSSK
jgi:hypothetical protein